MPIYEFSCDSCGHEFEKIVSFSATQSPPCPSCEADTVTRRMGRPAIHFKGSGWYITDSKKSNGNGSSNGSNGNGTSAKTESTDKAETTVKSETATKNEGSNSTTKSESTSTKAAVKADA